ncbi:Pimeloyl-ACP methyl ester carboxylesterase [Prauserella aidingensis]|uniref:alpha/beta fold hydrolase n=1 Tax=Prauserella aidingensis TaxID=387890 RepID=UPI0020A4A603|nr:alpha/beta fold hydrolase [Prauserella aidingensis]MCP2252418.1 Pimeloyl-ACP methyl ester carboxylesterase [Prauserella aidingensis]
MADLPLVLLHAYPLDARMWNAVRGPLSARTRVITPDQRGMGRSPFPDSASSENASSDSASSDTRSSGNSTQDTASPDSASQDTANPGTASPDSASSTATAPGTASPGTASGGGVDREPSLDDAARDVVALLDRLELDRVVLGGCSMGGYLTMAVLRAAPERVGGLVLIDTKAEADTDEARANRLSVADRAESEGVSDWLADAMLPNLLSEPTRERQPEVEALVRELIASQQPAGVAWAQRAMAARPDSTETLRGADVPALVIVGERDGLTPPDAARSMAEVLPSGRLETIPDAGHLTPLEAPDAVAAAITDWYPEA